jgi:hypothetical protein
MRAALARTLVSSHEGRRMKGVTGVLICIPAYGQSVTAQAARKIPGFGCAQSRAHSASKTCVNALMARTSG